MSTFVSHFNHDLSLKVLPPTTTSTSSQSPTPVAQTESKQSLRAYFLELEPPSSLSSARKCLATLQQFESEHVSFAGSADEEEATLRRAILGKLVVGLYVQGLDTFLHEASSADTELEWWSDIARSRWNVALYLLQTLPARVLNLSRTILHTIRSQNIPLQPSVLTPSSLRRLFPTTNILRPNALTIALFPYLRYQPYSISLSGVHFPASILQKGSLREEAESTLQALLNSISNLTRALSTFITFPLTLVQNECTYKKKKLETIRNERAEVLGALAEMRQDLMSALEESNNDEGMAKLAFFASQLQTVVRGENLLADQPVVSQGILGSLYGFAYTTLPAHVSFHSSHISLHALLRPSRLTLLWPRLVFLPPLALYLARSAYASRASLQEMALETLETLKGFWEGWLLGPLKDVIKTVRAGDEDGMIITRESVKADLDSLERMTLALAQDKLHYGPEQMVSLSQQIRSGDLTPVMQIYEDDIKNPLRSAISGTLIRTLFVQVQKAKVDMDQALSGIDKLLKSQELTFAFVGVAPALAIVYATVGYLRTLWTGGRGSGRYGGKKRRVRAWLAMRRIERLLIALPKSHREHQGSDGAEVSPGRASAAIPPLTSGLLLLSVTYLRTYAETYLRTNSRLREGFLEDVADLEDPALGRGEKMRVVDRMWKSWGEVLGWSRAAALSGPL